MNSLKAKLTINCSTCGCPMKRTKTIKVEANEKEAAMVEAYVQAKKWQKSLAGQNCKICKSILATV